MGDTRRARSKQDPSRARSTSEPRSAGRKLLGWLSYAAYLVVAAVAIDYVFFYRTFRSRLERPDPPVLTAPASDHDGLDLSVMRRVGRLNTNNKSHFVHASRAKPAGTVRLCALGDSFTAGNEADDDQDFPTLLGRLFGERGMAHVQVLNFGTGWHGFHQLYALWETIGIGYECDTVLLGPQGFWTRRNMTFNHTDLGNPYYLHSRYVLENGDVRRIDVLGDMPQERFDGYFSFLSRPRYLRYDRHPPAFIRAMLPSGRDIGNPFYYLGLDRDIEISTSYRILLRKMAAEAPQVLLVHVRQAIVEVGRTVRASNLVAARMPDFSSFPNSAPDFHFSAWGNRLVAEVFFSHLVHAGTQAPQGTVMLDADDLWPGVAAAPPRALSSYSSVTIQIDGGPVGLFTLQEDGVPQRYAPDVLAGEGIRSLIGFRSPGRSLLDGVFMPVDFDLEHGAQLTIAVGNEPPVELGPIVMPSTGANLGIVDVGGVRLRSHRLLTFDPERVTGLDELRDRAAEAELLVDGRVVATGVASRGFGFSPLAGRLRYIRAYEDEDGVPPPLQLPDGGVVELVLEDLENGEQASGGRVRAPLARWSPQPLSIEPTQAPLPLPMSRQQRE